MNRIADAALAPSAAPLPTRLPAPAVASGGTGRRLSSIDARAWVTAIGLLLLAGWELTGLDMTLAHLAGSAHGFALREHWFLDGVMHDGMRRVSWFLALLLSLGVWWPLGPLKRLGTSRRLQLALTTLLSAFLVSALKGLSTTSCPWDLQAFGGVARHVSHWWPGADGGPGHCFPAGHAVSGFSFLAGYFAFRHTDRRTAHRWLAAALAAGLVLGFTQQLRGAHFTSHTLWTAWLCWTFAWAVDRLWPATMAIEHEL
ncbi:phosphatase PAP2 family protein [Ramlibacter sp.]|uniref:phosphatase PAP2 family protein n=1 Tax=Ramlibacter sp. TaxID=1917967 RepID=UPI0025D02C11|nr:phosphatase PAP2 family protein [Ramlibacter sp.]